MASRCRRADYLALVGGGEEDSWKNTRGEIEKKVEDTLREGKKLEREIGEKLEGMETEAADYLVRAPLADLKEKYRDYPKVVGYLDGVRDHILKNLQRFKGADGSPGAGAMADAIWRAAERSVSALPGQRICRQQRYSRTADHRRDQSDLSQSLWRHREETDAWAATSPTSR